MTHRRPFALLSLLAVALALSLALTTSAENGDIILIAGELADEFNPSAAYDPVGNRYTIVYQGPNHAYRRDLSADGQTLEPVAEAFDTGGNVGDPFVAVAANGLSLYPFEDRRFDAHKDVSAKRRNVNAATFSAQFPVANGAGEQTPACIAALTAADDWYIWFYRRADANAPRQLLAQPMPGGLPLGQPATLQPSLQNEYVTQSGANTFREVSDEACLTTASGDGYIYAPTITLGNEGFATDLRAYGVSPAGVAFTSTQVVSLPVGAVADVAAKPMANGVLLVYQTDLDGVRAIRLATLRTPTGPISTTVDLRTQNDPWRPSLGCLPNGVCLAAWQEVGQDGQDDVWGVFIVGGTPGAPFAIVATEIAERNPSVAANGEDNAFAVVWEEGLDSGRDVRLRILTDVPPGQATATPTATATVGLTPTPTPTATLPATMDIYVYLPLVLRP